MGTETPLPPSEDCRKKAAEVGFDVTKQFLSLALAGIAFVVGLSFNTPGSVPSLIFWFTVVVFGLSVIVGLLFLMRGVGELNAATNFNIYSRALRLLSGLQIILVLLGVILLIPTLSMRPSNIAPPVTNRLEIKTGQQSIIYPIDPSKNLIIEVDDGKVKITDAKK